MLFQFHSFAVGRPKGCTQAAFEKSGLAPKAQPGIRVRKPLAPQGFLRICRACCLIRARPLGAVTPNLWDFQQTRRNGEEVAQCHFFKFCPYFSASAQAVNCRRKGAPLGGAPLQRSFMCPNERGSSGSCSSGICCISLGLSNAAASPLQTRKNPIAPCKGVHRFLALFLHDLRAKHVDGIRIRASEGCTALRLARDAPAIAEDIHKWKRHMHGHRA